MLVVEDKKKLLVQLENPELIISVIPTAKNLGEGYVAIPHRTEECVVLRNLGFNAPAPILHYYNWPGRYIPFEHQRLTAAFLTMNKRALVLNEIGCGKTYSALWAADYLMRTEQVRKAVILSPLSTLERVWADSIFAGFPNRKYVVLHGSAEKRRKLLNTEADFYIINHDGFQIIQPHLTKDFDLLIVDEAAVLRNPSTVRFRSVYKTAKELPNARLWLMTGTPTPNEPTDAWALARLVGSTELGIKSYTGFRDMVMMKAGQWRWVPRPSSPEIVARILQPSVRYTRDDCLDLPETVQQTRHAELTPEQRRLYKEMVKHLTTELHSGQITAANETTKLQKLLQISCGVAYDAVGEHIEIDCAPRIRILKELIEETNEKIVIFVPLTGALKMLERELSKVTSCAVVYGDVSPSKRAVIFRDFQETPEPRVIIAHPATMAHGLTLTSASVIVWYAPITSNEQYTQANGRIERIGKRHTSLVVHIEATQLEQKMYERLRGKQRLQGILLDLLMGEDG